MDGRKKVSEIDNTRCFKRQALLAFVFTRQRFETFNSIVASCFRTGDVEFNLSTVLETRVKEKKKGGGGVDSWKYFVSSE